VQRTIDIDEQDLPFVQAAAEWTACFYPDISLEITGSGMLLSSDVRASGRLSAIWRSALLNERLRSDSVQFRTSILERLAQ
jgi:hypothetical protein